MVFWQLSNLSCDDDETSSLACLKHCADDVLLFLLPFLSGVSHIFLAITTILPCLRISNIPYEDDELLLFTTRRPMYWLPGQHGHADGKCPFTCAFRALHTARLLYYTSSTTYTILLKRGNTRDRSPTLVRPLRHCACTCTQSDRVGTYICWLKLYGRTNVPT